MAVDAARAKSLFLAASELDDPGQRAEYLDRQCGDDSRLRARVEALLRADAAEPVAQTVDVPAHGEPGAVIADRYRLLEELGEGGMGEVWVAEQKEPVKRRVALKLIKAGMDSRQVLARFEAERQALAVMDHPNIAKVLDGGTTPQGRPYFVMELVKGIPLTDYCDEVQFTVLQRLELFTQVCSAVQHAHQKGIIHRDLKPSNILVTEHDGKPMCKVIDFGLAKALHGSQSLTDLSLHTAFGAVVGTPLYMAPEQLGVSALDVDTRSDLYSLGVVLYELLTGTTPIERDRLRNAVWEEMRRIVRDEDPPRPSIRLSSSDTLAGIAARRHIEPARLTSLVRGELDWIIMKALEKDRNRRYETANGLSLDIQRYLGGEAVLAAPPSRLYRTRKFVRRNRGPVIAASLLLLSLVGGMAGTTYGLFRANQAAEAERIAKRDAQSKQREAELQEAEAKKQQSRAEQREQAAIDAVKRFGDSVRNNPDLKNNPALETLRRTLLQEPLSFFESLRTRLQSDPDTRPESLARLAIAAYDLGILTEEIGDKQNAIEAYRQSIDILQKLVAANPTVTEFQRDLARSQNNIAKLLRETGAADQAFAAYEKALELRERLVQTNPTVSGFQRDLAASHNNLGTLLQSTGGTDKALEAFEKANETWERMVEANPTNAEAQGDLAVTQYNIGNLLRTIGETDKALAALERAIGILERLVQTDPTDTGFQDQLATCHIEGGILLLSTGKTNEALVAFEKALEIRERLAQASPAVTGFQSQLAVCHNNIAVIHRSTGKTAKALASFEEARKIWERLVQANPSSTEFQDRLAAIHNNIGSQLSEPAKALAAYKKAQEIWERLVQVNPTVTGFQSNLASIHYNIGNIRFATGEPDDALTALEKAVEIWEQLVHANPMVIKFQSDLGSALNNIAEIECELAHFDNARTYLLDAIKWQKRALIANPAHPTYRRFLMNHYTGLLATAEGLSDNELRLEARRGLADLAASDPASQEIDRRIEEIVGGAEVQGNRMFKRPETRSKCLRGCRDSIRRAGASLGHCP